jgi:hypothetical protein
MKRTDQAARLGAVGRAGNALLSNPRRRAARAAVSIALKPRSPIRTGAYKSRRTVAVCRCPLAESPAPPSVVSDTVRARPVVAVQPCRCSLRVAPAARAAIGLGTAHQACRSCPGRCRPPVSLHWVHIYCTAYMSFRRHNIQHYNYTPHCCSCCQGDITRGAASVSQAYTRPSLPPGGA